MLKINKQEDNSTLAWIVTLTVSLFFFYEFIQMNLFNTINADLRKTFQLDAVGLGQFFSMYFYGNALFLFPAGNLIDRYSTKKILLLAVSICTVGTFFFALATVYWLAALGRFMEGLGASFCFLSCIRVASRWFPPAKMAFVTGVIVTMAMVGGLVAQTPFSFLSHALGSWRYALLANAILGILIGIAILVIVKDRPPNSQAQAKADQHQLKTLGLWQCIKVAAFNPQNWFGGLYTALINLPVFILGGLWGVLYLVQVHHLTLNQASYATTAFFIGVIIGSPLFGFFSDKLGRRVLPMIIGAILSLISILILMYMPSLSLWPLIFIFCLIGLVTSSQVLTYPMLAELNPIYLTSTAISIDSVCIMVSGFIVPPFFGWLMERETSSSGIYVAQNFHHALLIIPFCFLIALLITPFMQETYCRSQG